MNKSNVYIYIYINTFPHVAYEIEGIPDPICRCSTGAPGQNSELASNSG